MSVSGFSPRIFAACVSPLEDSVLYKAAYALASPARRQKADRFLMEKDRRLCLGAELLLRRAVHSVGAGDFFGDFRYGEYGKPCFGESTLRFNLSHSEEWVVCAVANCEVGCDVELIAPVDPKLAERFFSGDEYRDILSQPAPEAETEMFFRYWTLKESFMKATGLGMKLSLRSFEIVLGEEISVRQSVDGRQYFFREYGDIPGYRCAACAVGERPDDILNIVDLGTILSNSQ